jgi:hypothetical protein
LPLAAFANDSDMFIFFFMIAPYLLVLAVWNLTTAVPEV